MLSGGMGMLGRRGRKERKRLMALLLAGAMVLSVFYRNTLGNSIRP